MIESWAVVENASYEKEFIWPKRFTNIVEAEKFIGNRYEKDEVESLHVEIAYITPEGNISYEY